MFADRASFYRYAAVLGSITGAAYAVGYHASVKIQNFADKAFDGIPLPAAIPHFVRATICSVLSGFLLTMSFLMLICPIRILADNDVDQFAMRRMRPLLAFIFLGDVWLTVNVIRSAFFND